MIVVTGLGAVTALGANVEETWRRVLRGDRGFRPITLFSAEGYRASLVAEVANVTRREGRDFSRTSELAVRAAREAIDDAGLATSTRRVGLVVGGTTAGMFETESLLAVLVSPEGTVDPAARKRALLEMLGHPLSAPTDRLARELGPFVRARSLSSACSSGANAILVGASWLELGLVDAVLCGAADALCRVTLSGFNSLTALDPEGARPFDARRRGLTLGEGAGFFVLERCVDARARGKAPICALLGAASRSEAHHITNPEPTGDAPTRAMSAALVRANVTAADVDYVNAHGTGTELNDPMESRALARVFGAELARVRVSSQKGQIGHTLAASGAIEAVITARAIADDIVPPTGGLETPDAECPLRHVTKAEPNPVRVAVSSSFGFGGMDTVLVLGKPGAERPPRIARRVVVTGVATLTPAGLAVGREVADLPLQRPEQDVIADELAGSLDPSRARRLDRASRLAALAASRALASSPSDAGVVLGSAFGAVDGSAAFMRRLVEKGPRFVSPAEFPSLVPSSPAGHVSIYLGLTGPALVVADLAASGEAAFVQAWELVAAGHAEHIAAVAVEERSAIVEQILRVLFESGAPGSRRREGAAAIALAAADVTTQDVLAEVDRVETWTHDAPPAFGTPLVGAVVVLASASGSAAEIVARSSWADVPRVTCDDAVGTHEAVGGIALAVAVAKIARGDAKAALCVGSARGSGYAIWLRA